MAPILNFHAGSLPSFALRLKSDDSLDSLKSRAAKKIRLQLDDGIPLVIKYGWSGQAYTLEDSDDWEIFLERFGNEKEADLYLESPEIPTNNRAEEHSADGAHDSPNVPLVDESTLVHRTPGRGKSGGVSIHRVAAPHIPSADDYSEAGGVTAGGRDSIMYPPPREPAAQPGYSKPSLPEPPAPKATHDDAISTHTSKTRKTNQTAVSSVPSHKIAFQEFHSQLGVRLLKGSIGPIQDVPMMLKSGYRHVYVSRSFALNHGFIPKDTTPGTYGFNGITNLGKWPVQVGSKAVPCTVMLAEDSYFPVILGRSFMEKRGVRTDPIDMTSVTFMDNGERADVEVVVVRDEHGEPVPIP
ncbi:hypothetical protein NDA11_005978 [Ustilago hordei]|uniref:Uncharacterized protein n=1 Tax=Ustilago hordei TaxID=120017 RepID=I2FP26_USTHO|nr:uncharacterized protein UHO2_05438 [Ustilago hordei]KAJ1039769.1 hypothetical protein NDA10_007451 [Ustilago hordei]KAJ1574093.1 hypothetical protein NDA12_004013 [Ustilago hordei]KAJ1574507.1 hypothetical protein NDA15_003977 [Ustilago hordei]KAJ1580399.1 hypothetical protein NDA11_005978 [Ustilago hordei]KAJ1599430.1 hypothetical protein NDA14_001840 [Ustilago hordei]